MKIALFILLLAGASAARSQDFKRASSLGFEYPAVRTVSGGREFSFSFPAHQREMLAVLSTATRLDLYPAVSFAVAVEGEMMIDGISYRLFFPRVPPRETPYVFAAGSSASLTDRTYFEIPRERSAEFSRLFLSFFNDHPIDSRQ